MIPQPLNLMGLPLSGSHLIEASAGTGKTWTLASLYVRCILGHGEGASLPALMPPDILVMTFTRAATRELSDRIRKRLAQAAAALRSEQAPNEPFLSALWSHYPDARRAWAAHRLALAAQAMDEAAIFTLDAWCHRMLREHALQSRGGWTQTLVADESALRLQAVQDHWRQQVYPLSQELTQVVLAQWPSVQALYDDVVPLLDLDLPQGDPQVLALCLPQWLSQQQSALAQLKAGWVQASQQMATELMAQLSDAQSGWNRQKLQRNRVAQWLQALHDWAQGPGGFEDLRHRMQSGWDRFTPSGLAACRLPDAPPAPNFDWSLRYAQLLENLQQLPSLADRFRLHARSAVALRLHKLKQARHQWGFADLQVQLVQALSDPDGGPELAMKLRKQFPVAMVDEFQDTSPVQWQLLDVIYRVSQSPADAALLLIGDPKQSIYGFRGADIHSYLRARRATEGRHHMLDTNHRSSPQVVAVINHLFGQAHSWPAGPFGYREADHDPVPFWPVHAQARPESLRRGQQAEPALTWVHDGTLRNTAQALLHCAGLCAEHIVRCLTDPQLHWQTSQGSAQAVRPRDIAVLVRDAREAQAVRQALRARGVGSVYLSDRDNVLASDEAQDLVLWLQGVSEPQRTRAVMSAMGTRLAGLSVSELHHLTSDELALESQVQTLLALQQVWQQQGVLAMLRQSLHRMQWAMRWRQQLDGERRLTNYLHLAELLQNASQDVEGPAALIRWLLQATHEAHLQASAEEQLLRLESDEALVQVVTIHKSKGLEYPIVCLPFAHSVKVVQRRRLRAVAKTTFENRQWQLHIDDEAVLQADQDRLREDTRLLYVALTRARHALWMAWSPLRQGTSPQCINHRSAMGHLLAAGQAHEAQDWPQRIAQTLSTLGDVACNVVWSGPVPLTVMPADSHAPSGSAVRVQALPLPPPESDHWRIASFSRIVRQVSAQTGAASVAQSWWTPHPADDEPEVSHPTESVPAAQGPWHRFPRGSSAGNFLHEQLEALAHEGFAWSEASVLARRLPRACARLGWESHAQDLAQWLARLADLPLQGPQASLREVAPLWPEMEFWLPAAQLPLAEVDRLCRLHLWPDEPRPALPEADWPGMVMGFVDLVFEHQGRFWVLDHKSNHLGPSDAHYNAQALQHTMCSHRYDLQAVLYLLALHRLLRARLGAHYQPECQLGGAIYLFLRGIDGPAAGQCTLAPPWPLLNALDQLLAPNP